MKRSHKKITAEEFDKRFDKGEDMGNCLNKNKTMVHKEIQKVNAKRLRYT